MEKQLPASFEILKQIKDRFRDESRNFFLITLQQIPLHLIPTQLMNVVFNCQWYNALRWPGSCFPCKKLSCQVVWGASQMSLTSWGPRFETWLREISQAKRGLISSKLNAAVLHLQTSQHDQQRSWEEAEQLSRARTSFLSSSSTRSLVICDPGQAMPKTLSSMGSSQPKSELSALKTETVLEN